MVSISSLLVPRLFFQSGRQPLADQSRCRAPPGIPFVAEAMGVASLRGRSADDDQGSTLARAGAVQPVKVYPGRQIVRVEPDFVIPAPRVAVEQSPDDPALDVVEHER